MSFSFGGGGFGTPGAAPQQQQPQQQGTPSFSFGQPAAATPKPAGGLFGTPAQQQPAGQTGTPAFSFGAQPQQQQQQQQPAKPAFSFGTPASSQQQQQQPTGGLFGQSTQQQAGTPSGGLFGQQPQQQQATPAGGLFGNTTSTNTGGGLFGNQPQQQQQQQQPGQSGGLFGQQSTAQPQSAGLFGNSSVFGQQQQQQPQQQQPNGLSQQQQQQQQQPQPQPSLSQSVFGQTISQPQFSWSRQQQAPPQQMPLFGQSTNRPFAPSQSVYGAGSASTQTATSQSTYGPAQPASIQDQLLRLKNAWDPTHPDCMFRAYFYNRVGVETAALYTKPADHSQRAWEEAVAARPDDAVIPVLAVGFNDLRARVQSQEQQVYAYRVRMNECAAKLDELANRHALHASPKLSAARQRQQELARRALALAAKTQVLKCRGYALRPEEEQLRQRLRDLQERANRPDTLGRLDDVWAKMTLLKQRQKQISKEIEADGYVRVINFDDQEEDEGITTDKDGLPVNSKSKSNSTAGQNAVALQHITQVLADHAKGIAYVSDLLKADLQAVDGELDRTTRHRNPHQQSQSQALGQSQGQSQAQVSST
ncbi:hypothetical protein PYCC9005_002568 [Savitreella phatthalungensis]